MLACAMFFLLGLPQQEGGPPPPVSSRRVPDQESGGEQSVLLPTGTPLTIEVDRNLPMRPKPQDKVIVPLILIALASRPLDRNRGDNAFGKNAVASNSIGLAGFLAGTAGGWRNVAAGIGFYGTALAIYNRWIKRGQETSFRQNTRIVLQTMGRRTAPMQAAQPLHP